jgi:hypothetical protein
MSRAQAAAIAFVGLLAFGHLEPAAGAELRKHALVIGINGLGLNFADQDAQAFASFIETPQGGGFQHANVRVLVNNQANREGILVQGIAWVGKRVREDRNRGAETLVYVFYAGHGQKRPNTDEAYLLPFGADPDAPQGLGIRADDFVTEVRKEIQATTIVYFLDACHAGASVVQGGIARAVRPNVYPSLDTLFQQNLARREVSRMGFMSAQAHQESFEDPKIRHGVFTYYLLQGLQRLEADQQPFGDDDGIVTADELVRYLNAKVPAHVDRMFAGASVPPRQYPEPSPGYNHEFPLASKTQPVASSREILRLIRKLQEAATKATGGEYEGSQATVKYVTVRNGLRVTQPLFYVGDDHGFKHYGNQFPAGKLKCEVHWESAEAFDPKVVCSGLSGCLVQVSSNTYKVGKPAELIGREYDLSPSSAGRYTVNLVANGVSVAESSFEIVSPHNVKATFLGTDLAGPTVMYADGKNVGTLTPKGKLEVIVPSGTHSLCIERPEIACETRYLPAENISVFQVTNTSVKRTLLRLARAPSAPGEADADSALKIFAVGEDGKPISDVQVAIAHKDGTFAERANGKEEIVGLAEAVMCAKDGYSGAFIPVTGAEVTCRLKSTPGEGSRIFTDLWHFAPGFMGARLDFVPLAGGRFGLKTTLRISGPREQSTVSPGESFRVTDVFGRSRELQVTRVTGKLALVEYRKQMQQPPLPDATRISILDANGAAVRSATLAVLEKNKMLTLGTAVGGEASVDLKTDQIEAVLCWNSDYGAAWVSPIAAQPVQCKVPIIKGGGSRLFTDLWGYVPGFTQKRLDLLPLANGRIQLKTDLHAVAHTGRRRQCRPWRMVHSHRRRQSLEASAGRQSHRPACADRLQINAPPPPAARRHLPGSRPTAVQLGLDGLSAVEVSPKTPSGERLTHYTELGFCGQVD